MSELYETAIVEKRNVLNELRSNNMTLQELRFFSIYLSKIDPWNTSTRVVRFPIEDFQRIMGFGRLNISQLKASTDSLLTKIVHIPNENGGYTAFQLFKRCRVDKNNYDDWFVEIDASDDALPLMFDFKNRYFKYELWNALQLKSANQIRMYEILKQYEGLGKRELTVTELRELLGISKNEYSGRTGWSDFKKYVLDSCQQALMENTDISYTYERGKVGKGGKWLTIIFHIHKNENYVDRLSLKEFIDLQPESQPIENISAIQPEPQQQPISQPIQQKQQPTQPKKEIDYDYIDSLYDDDDDNDNKNDNKNNWENKNITMLLDSCDNEFSIDEILLLTMCVDKSQLPDDQFGATNAVYKYLCKQYIKLNIESKNKKIKNRFKYLMAMIESDFNNGNNRK